MVRQIDHLSCHALRTMADKADLLILILVFLFCGSLKDFLFLCIGRLFSFCGDRSLLFFIYDNKIVI